ncbi:MAG: FtsX-like permease family protein, partial [Candidatus Aminicenantes bacterium]|nr:FtsX-like permease family protein [Candidatus Aminicenantes bacterium]
PASLSDGLSTIWTSHIADPDKRPIETSLFPFKDFRLKGHHIQTFITTSHPTGVFIGMFIGVLLLVIVCINFINLSTARSMHRIREIGLRKVIGAGRGQLIKQFMAESLLLSFLALPLAVLLYELLHPAMASYFGDFALLDTTTRISNSIFNYPFLWKYLIGAAVITGFLSGIYPALHLSSFHPLQALKGSTQTGRKKQRGSKILIVTQFTLSILFIALAGILKDQTARLFQADFGFSRDQVAIVRIPPEAQSIRSLFAAELRGRADVLFTSASGNIPLVWDSRHPVTPAGGTEEDRIDMELYGVGENFLQTMGLELLRGKGFELGKTDSRSLVISENAAAKLPFDDPIGKQLEFDGRTGTIIGITKNFLFADIGFSIPPNVLYLEPERLNFVLIKYLPTTNPKDLEAGLKDSWQTLAPGLPFEFTTLEEYFGNTFGLIKRISGILNMIGLTAVLFSCFGLLGLVSFLLERRAKEIGMRKILGASLSRILWHLGREYVILVVAANVIALGLFHYGWYRVLKTGLVFLTPAGAGVYVTAFAVTLTAAVAAVVSRSWKVAHTNPVDTLKLE